MQIIKTFLVTALVITTTIVAALPATSDSLIQLSSKIKLDDPGIWNYTVCNAICLIEENNCRRNKGISKELCADEVCTFNQAYCDCFCYMYDCPRSEGTIDHCNASKRSELLALAEKEIEKRQATGEVTGEVAEATGEGAAGFSLEKREELQAAEASGEVQDCGALCRYHEDVCVRSHRDRSDCKKDICSALVDDHGCKQCPTYACVIDKDIEKRAVEIEKGVADVDHKAADCTESCQAIENHCVNNFHRSRGDCHGDVCGDVRSNCKHCANYAKTCPH